jgi:hypothetical protein
MKRWIVVAMVAAAMALVPTAAAAADREGRDGAVFGPYSSGSTDSGTCGNDWAADTFKRVFFVQQTGPATWRVTEAFVDGHFVTVVGPSPGACEKSSPHGTVILPGVNGIFAGFLSGTVTGGSFSPNGCDVAAACSKTSTFILAVFGSSASYDITSFYFDYHSGDPRLIYRHWVNASDNLGGNRGDIATS